MKNFSFDPVTDFDQHIRDSIPGYDVLVQQTLALAPNFVQPRTRGTLLNTLFTRLPATSKNRLIGYALAENLLPPYEQVSSIPSLIPYLFGQRFAELLNQL